MEAKPLPAANRTKARQPFSGFGLADPPAQVMAEERQRAFRHSRNRGRRRRMRLRWKQRRSRSRSTDSEKRAPVEQFVIVHGSPETAKAAALTSQTKMRKMR